jgi:hypothetical protein
LHPEHAVASGAKRLTFVCDFTQNLHNVQLPKGSQGSTAVASGAKRLTFVFAFTQTDLGDGFSSAYRRAAAHLRRLLRTRAPKEQLPASLRDWLRLQTGPAERADAQVLTESFFFDDVFTRAARTCGCQQFLAVDLRQRLQPVSAKRAVAQGLIEPDLNGGFTRACNACSCP